MGVCFRTCVCDDYLDVEGMHDHIIPPYHVRIWLASFIEWRSQILLTALVSITRDGLSQQRLVKYLTIWVFLGFVGSELALFLICRPLPNYWAVPTPDC